MPLIAMTFLGILVSIPIYMTIGMIIMVITDEPDNFWKWGPMLFAALFIIPLMWVYDKVKDKHAAYKKSRIPPAPSDILAGMLSAKLIQYPENMGNDNTWSYKASSVQVFGSPRNLPMQVYATINGKRFQFNNEQEEKIGNAFYAAKQHSYAAKRNKEASDREREAAELLTQL